MTSLQTYRPFDDCLILIIFCDWLGNEIAEKHIFSSEQTLCSGFSKKKKKKRHEMVPRVFQSRELETLKCHNSFWKQET